SISFNIGRLLISLLMRTPPFLFSREKLLYQRRESSSYFLEIEGIFQLCPRKYFTHTRFLLMRSEFTFKSLYKSTHLLVTSGYLSIFFCDPCAVIKRLLPNVRHLLQEECY